MGIFHFGRLPFWSSSILVVFHFGHRPFWLLIICLICAGHYRPHTISGVGYKAGHQVCALCQVVLGGVVQGLELAIFTCFTYWAAQKVKPKKPNPKVKKKSPPP